MRGVSRRGDTGAVVARGDESFMAPSCLLCIRGVSKAYPDGASALSVLERATLELDTGAQVGLYGRRRAGKSTLLRIAAGIEPPDSGIVTFEGIDLTKISGTTHARMLRSRIAYVAVTDWRPNPGESIAQHVAVSLGGGGRTVRQAEHRALRELDVFGVSAMQANSAATELSVVDRSRVMFARAFAHEPRLMIVDDPVLTPSAVERDSIYRLLRTVARERGIALLVASDDLPALQGFDVLMSISAREICTSEANARVVPFPSPPHLDPILDTGS